MSLGNFYISAAINTSVIVFKEPVNALFCTAEQVHTVLFGGLIPTEFSKA